MKPFICKLYKRVIIEPMGLSDKSMENLPEPKEEDDPLSPEAVGGYTLSMDITTNQRRVAQRVLWHDSNKRVLRRHYQLDKMLTHAIYAEARSKQWTGTLNITGYTELKIPYNENGDCILFRSSPFYRGKVRQDWAVVRFKRENELCFARIKGFIRYETDTYPKPGQNVEDPQPDQGLYCVLDCCRTFFDLDRLWSEMVVPFSLVNSDKGLYILPIECIECPLAVVTNWMSKRSTYYLACAPKRKWHVPFRLLIQQETESPAVQSEVDNESESDDSINLLKGIEIEDTSEDESIALSNDKSKTNDKSESSDEESYTSQSC